jgi:signal transduction histidine kinase
MDEETQRRLFEPLFTEGREHGIGLGMAIVKSVVEAHGGTVEVDSTPGVGTEIRCRVPTKRS